MDGRTTDAPAGGAGPAASGELWRLLARRLRESGQRGDTTVSVAELHRELVPYPICRDALGFATKAEYDLALLHLLRQGEAVRAAEDALSEAVEKELDSPEPGLAFLKHFAASPIEVRALEVGATAGAVATEAAAESGTDAPGAESRAPDPRTGDPEPPADAGEPESGGMGTSDALEATPAPRVPSAGEWLATLERAVERRNRERTGETEADRGDRGEAGEAGEAGRCFACEGELPARPGVRYCPHCGADQTRRECRSCGEPMESGWKFCPRCGAAADGS